jgi:hypothetical protein
MMKLNFKTLFYKLYIEAESYSQGAPARLARGSHWIGQTDFWVQAYASSFRNRGIDLGVPGDGG